MANLPQQSNSSQPRNLAQLVAALGPQSQVMQQSKVDPKSLAAGIQASYAITTFKGKTWNIRYRGNDHPLLVRDPQTGNILGSVPTIDVVIIRSAVPISKTFYLKDFTEGSFARPDCWSTNGVAPDPAVPPSTKQNDTCPGCKWDAFGSSTRQVEGGQVIRAKRCSDNKRIAIVPAGDLKNEAYGGPMLLRLPPTTFSGLAEVQDQLMQQGYHYAGVVMRCSFDHAASHPKIIFTPIRVLDDHEAQEIVALQDSQVVNRILSEEITEVKADPKQAAAPEAGPPIQPPRYDPTTQPYDAPQRHAEPRCPKCFGPMPCPTHSQPQPQPQPHVPTATEVRGMATTAFNPGTPPAQPVQQDLPPPVEMTAEQRRIAELEAKLEALAKPARRTTKRTAPVTPLGQPTVQQAQAPAPTSPPDDEGDAPADLDSRIDALLKPNGGATN